MKVFVQTLMKGETPDPQGQVVKQRLVEMGYSDVRGIRVGKLIEIDLDLGEEKAAIERVNKMCAELLVNSSIEEFKITFADN